MPKKQPETVDELFEALRPFDSWTEVVKRVPIGAATLYNLRRGLLLYQPQRATVGRLAAYLGCGVERVRAAIRETQRRHSPHS